MILEAASQGVAHASNSKYQRPSGVVFMEPQLINFFRCFLRSRLHAAAGDESAPHLPGPPILHRGEAPSVAE